MGALECIAKKIIDGLSKEELRQLIEFYEEGSINDLFLTYLYAADIINYPEKYQIVKGPDY